MERKETKNRSLAADLEGKEEQDLAENKFEMRKQICDESFQDFSFSILHFLKL